MADWKAGFVIAAILHAVILATALLRVDERPANLPLALALLALAGMLLI